MSFAVTVQERRNNRKGRLARLASHFTTKHPVSSQYQKPILRVGGVTFTETPSTEGEAKAVFSSFELSLPSSLEMLENRYNSMNIYWREYCRDSLVRKSINARAFWATNKGFDTVLEPPMHMSFESDEAAQAYCEKAEFKQVKAQIDDINRKVELDSRLYAAIVLARACGRGPFEIVGGIENPTKLIPLESDQLEPLIGDGTTKTQNAPNWKLVGFKYDGEGDYITPKYKPEQVLYFVNNDVDTKMLGMSDIEPILWDLQTRRTIRREAFPESAKTLWAGQIVLTIDVSGIPDEQGRIDAIEGVIKQIKPGKVIGVSQNVKAEVVNLNPALDKLVQVKDSLDREIIGNFEVPKFLINREEQVNRATAEKQFEGFVQGPVEDDRRMLKRQIERQWYEPLTRKFLNLPLTVEPGQVLEPATIRLTHRWREIQLADFFTLLEAGTKAYGQAAISQEKFYELMRDGLATKFDPAELEKTPVPQE